LCASAAARDCLLFRPPLPPSLLSPAAIPPHDCPPHSPLHPPFPAASPTMQALSGSPPRARGPTAKPRTPSSRNPRPRSPNHAAPSSTWGPRARHTCSPLRPGVFLSLSLSLSLVCVCVLSACMLHHQRPPPPPNPGFLTPSPCLLPPWQRAGRGDWRGAGAGRGEGFHRRGVPVRVVSRSRSRESDAAGQVVEEEV
jgi:hypothetical protein